MLDKDFSTLNQECFKFIYISMESMSGERILVVWGTDQYCNEHEIMVLRDPYITVRYDGEMSNPLYELDSDHIIVTYNDDARILFGPRYIHGQSIDGGEITILSESEFKKGFADPPDLSDDFLSAMIN